MRTLALEFAAGQLPTEFRLFTAGWNDTENGRFLFDAEAASTTMAAYRKWGVDLAIDLEHQMLEYGIPPDPTAKDARGWCNLELRNGELWAVNVKWTADGAQRLSEKRQRYVSPAFGVDPETSRITSVVNVAITAIPATHETPALVAASARGAAMDPAMVKEALDALIAGDGDKCMEMLKNLVASAASGGEPVEEAPVEEPILETNATPPEPDVETQEQIVAAKKLMRLSGASSPAQAMVEAEAWRTSHLTLETERLALAKERATLESAERRKLCIELVTLGAEFPSTVWADPHDKGGTLKPRWLGMPIEELRAHTAEQRAARGGKAAPKPPTAPGATTTPAAAADVEIMTPLGLVKLSAREVQNCAETGAKLEVYAANKAFQQKARGTKGQV